MPDLRHAGWIGTKWALMVVICASLLLLSFSGIAEATTPAIQKAQQQAKELLALVNQLDEELSAVAEEYNYAAQQLKDTQAAIKKTQAQIATAEKDLAKVQDHLNQRVVEIYKSGDLSMLGVLLAAESFSDLIGRYDQLQRLSAQDADLLRQVTDYKNEVTDRRAELNAQLATEQTQFAETEAAKEKVQAQLAKQQEALKGKEAQVAALKKQEAARQAALLAAAKKAAAEAARKAAAAKAAAAAKKKAGTSTGSTGTGTPGYDADRSARVVEIALQYVGVPYVWGGSSPSGFDCSGLVQYSYGKIGVYLPHSSVMQYRYGVPVSKSELKPGDLVFFYNPIHHVGIYIGNGRMVNATGDRVQIGAVWKNSYYGARRILD